MTGCSGDEREGGGFDFAHHKPSLFAVSGCRCCGRGFYLLWRAFWACWHLSWLVISIYETMFVYGQGRLIDGTKWLIYLTHWTYLSLNVQSITSLLVALRHACSGKAELDGEEGPNPRLHKFLWFMTSYSFAATVMVTAFYTAVLLNVETIGSVSIATHYVTIVYVISDTFVNSIPVRPTHFVYPVLYGVAYSTFTYIYYLYGGTAYDGAPNLYPGLDWRYPESTLLLTGGMAFVGQPLGHLVVFLLFSLRRCFAKICGCKPEPVDEEKAFAKVP